MNELGDSWRPGASWVLQDDGIRRRWLAAIHEAARTAQPSGRVVGEVRDPGPGWNYYSVRVSIEGEQRKRLLLNPAVNLVACALDEESAANGPLRFCDVPQPGIFTAAGFRVAAVDDLVSPLLPEHIAALSSEEQADISYHRPDAVGDVLFNWFD